MLTRKNCCKGYTLIEVLVVVVIFSSMIALATAGLSQILNYYENLRKSSFSLSKYLPYLWVDEVFENISDYYIKDNTDNWFLLFKGDEDSMVFVSFKGLSGDSPKLVIIKKEKNSESGYDLVIYETEAYFKDYESVERLLIFKDYKQFEKFVFLSKIDNLRIRYYVYDNLLKRYDWSYQFDPKKNVFLPSMVAFQYDENGQRKELYFKIYNNSSYKAIYNELYQK